MIGHALQSEFLVGFDICHLKIGTWAKKLEETRQESDNATRFRPLYFQDYKFLLIFTQNLMIFLGAGSENDYTWIGCELKTEKSCITQTCDEGSKTLLPKVGLNWKFFEDLMHLVVGFH